MKNKDNLKVICCGSKKYKNIEFNKLVDSFDFIVRHNMLIPNVGYGRKTSNLQILNNNVIVNYESNSSDQEWIDRYCEELGVEEEHVLEFLNYLKKEKPCVANFQNNNTHLLIEILKEFNIDHPFVKMEAWNGTRCTSSPGVLLIKNGLSYVVYCIKNNVKPYLIGYSLKSSELSDHCFNSKASDKLNKCHKDNLECDLIIKLHELKLLDASFCAIEDCEKVKFNSLIEPTEESIKILENINEYSA